MTEEEPLHAMNPTTRFEGRAETYAKWRPDYPDAAFAILLSEGIRRVVDVGAGTGISSWQLAERGVEVVAIEPNESMMRAAQPHERVTWIRAAAESIPLASGIADLVGVFQAFHWLDPGRSLEEFHRILVPEGRVAVVWNDRDPSDEFTARYGALIRKASGGHPAERRMVLKSIPFEEHGFGPGVWHRLSHGQELSLQGLRGRAESASYIPSSGQEKERLDLELQDLFERYCGEAGRVRIAYITHVVVAETRN